VYFDRLLLGQLQLFQIYFLISKLIKLKNISGKVVIDPVASDQNTLRKLVGMLKNEFRDDLSITNVYGYTRGGLLELSRSRNDRSIDELNLQ
jgi:ribonuclease G